MFFVDYINNYIVFKNDNYILDDFIAFIESENLIFPCEGVSLTLYNLFFEYQEYKTIDGKLPHQFVRFVILKDKTFIGKRVIKNSSGYFLPPLVLLSKSFFNFIDYIAFNLYSASNSLKFLTIKDNKISKIEKELISETNLLEFLRE